MTRIIHFPTTFLLFFTFIMYSLQKAIIAIDYGDDTTKVGFVAHGHGIKIMLDEQTNRKSPSMIFFGTDNRFYGHEAKNQLISKPHMVSSGVKKFLGNPYGSQIENLASKENLLNSFLINSNNEKLKETNSKFNAKTTLNFSTEITKDKIMKISPEELLAMQIKRICKLMKNNNKLYVKEASFLTPNYFVQSQRESVLHAIEIANVKPICLVGENSSASIQYALHYKGKKPKIILIFNMGQSKTEITMTKIFPKHKKVKEEKTNPKKPNPQKHQKVLEMKYAFNDSLGGKSFDLVVAKLLADDFAKQHQNENFKRNVFNDLKSRTTLLSHSKKVKEILSANTETSVNIESLYKGKNLKTIILRSRFEEASKHLINEVDDMLKGFEKLYEEIVPIGGAIRLPILSQKLSHFGKVSRTLNTDEAAALGAAFYSTQNTKGFRVNQKIELFQLNVYEIKLVLELKKSKREFILFTNKNYFGDENIIKIDDLEDNSVVSGNVFYSKSNKQYPIGQEKNLIFQFDINSNLNSKNQNKTSNFDGKNFEMLFNIDKNGLVHLKEVFSIKNETRLVEIEKDETIEEDDKKDKINNITKIEMKNKTINETDSIKLINETILLNKTIKKKIKVNKTFEKKTNFKFNYRLDKENNTKNVFFDKKASKKLLKEFEKRDLTTKNAQNAKNDLEEFIYNLQEIFESKIYKEFSTENERKVIGEKYNEVKEWVEVKGQNIMEEKIFKEKKSKIQNSTENVFKRINEYNELPKTAKQAFMGVEAIFSVVNDTIVNKTWINKDIPEKLLNDTKVFNNWLNSTLLKQKYHNKTAEPLIKSSEIANKINKLIKQAEELQLRERIEPKKSMNITNITKNRKRRRRKRKKLNKNNKKSFFKDIINKTKNVFKSSEKKEKESQNSSDSKMSNKTKSNLKNDKKEL